MWRSIVTAPRQNSKTAIAFVRVSSDDQAKGLSLSSQEQKIGDWCAARGYQIVETIRAEGESAYTDDIRKRPQFSRLLERLKVLRPDVVVVYSMDRWARSLVVSSSTIRMLRDWGVRFASVTDPEFDFSSPASDLQFNIFASISQFSSDMTAQHVRRVNDLKFEKGIHRGPPPFGYIADPLSTRGDPRPPIPEEREFPVVQELFRRMLSGRETYRSVANWLNRQGFVTRNRMKSAVDGEAGSTSPRKFTEESIRSIVKNPFYAGLVVKQSRSRRGGPKIEPIVKPGLHVPAVTPEDFNRVQSIVRAHYRAPRTVSPKFRPYLGKGLVYCIHCGQKAWCHTIKGLGYYQESSASRGLTCDAAGKYWPAPKLDDQIEHVVRPVALPADWRERAVELANAENNVIDLRSERLSLERRRRRILEDYWDDQIDRQERDRRIGEIDNRLKTIAPMENVQFVEITVADFESIQSFWDGALPEERAGLFGRLAEKLYVDFETGQVLEIVPRSGFRYVLEAAQIVKPPGGSALTIGDPEGIRTPDLHRDRVAC
jgi:site-specific DNA recombinase